MNDSFSLIVPAYKEEDFIENSLSGLLKAFRNENFDFEIIVIIDREPDDKTHEIVEKIATNSEEIKILARYGKRGIAKAVLDGINKASKIYEHGISMEQTAKLLGISMYDIASYAGQKGISDIPIGKTISVRDRIKLAMDFFK